MAKTIRKSNRRLSLSDLIIFFMSFICLIFFVVSSFKNSVKIEQKEKELNVISEEYDDINNQNHIIQEEIERVDQQVLIQEAHKNGFVFPDERVYVEIN